MKEKNKAETEALRANLNATGWSDISIQTLPEGKETLILICKNREASNLLNELLHQNAFDLKISADKTTGNHTFIFELIDTEIAFKLNTPLNAKNYPPIEKLRDNGIGFLTTGVWKDSSGKRGACEYNGRLKRLGDLDIESCLIQAERVQFAAGELDKSPSAVLLIFKDYDHIIAAEADKAYNKLAEMTISKPKLGIFPTADGKIDITIWDILVDLQISIKGLKYDKAELDKFLSESNEDHSFAFTLGFPPTEGAKASIASTKREGFEFITLYGYTYHPLPTS